MHWTGPGKCLIAWDGGYGPTWDDGERHLGECEVWRADAASATAAVCIGVTKAEAFLDREAPDGRCLWYWVMERTKSGGLSQVGPVIDVEMPSRYPDDFDLVPPTQPDLLKARRSSSGNVLTWLPSADEDHDVHVTGSFASGLLAYLIYESSEDQPDHVVWASDSWEEGGGRRVTYTDESGTARSSYMMTAIDENLNESEPRGRTTASGEVVEYEDTEYGPQSREPVVPVIPEGGGRQNRVTNPQFGGEDFYGWPNSAYLTVDSSPPVSLPDGCAQAARLDPTSTGTFVQSSGYFYLEEAVRGIWASCFLYRPAGKRTKVELSVWGEESGAATIQLYDDDEADAGFVRRFRGLGLQPDHLRFDIVCTFYDCTAEEGEAWVTGFMVEPDPDDSDDPGAYADGDTGGWEWDGTPHESTSRESA